MNWDYDSTSGKSFSVTSRAQDQIRYRYSYDGGSTWGGWGNWQNNGSSYSASYKSSITSGSSYFSISGNTVTPKGSNTTFSANTGTVTVSNAGDTAYVSLSQDGAPADYDYRISISPSSYNFSSSAGSHSFTVTVEQRYKPVTSSSWGSWSTIGNNYSSSISGTGFSRSQSGDTVTVNVTSNTSTTSGRSGTLTVTCDYTSDLTGTRPSASASLTQDKYVNITTKTEYQYEFSVSPTSLSFDASGGTKSVTVTSRRRPITLTYTNGNLTNESAGSWSTWSSYSGRISSGEGFSVSETSVTAGANSSTSSREGNLELTQTQTSDYSGSTDSYKSDSSNINVPLDQDGKKRERITMNITRVPYLVVYLFHPSYIPQNNTSEFQYFAYSTTDNTLTLEYYLDQGVSVNTTPRKTVNVLPGNDIDIYITGLVMFIVDIELLNYLIQA